MKQINPKVGVEFNRLLSGHPAFFGSKYLLISPCQKFLHAINHIGVLNECEFVSYHSKAIKQFFRSHNEKYKPSIDALVELKLLEIKHCYINNAQNRELNRCNEYRVTEFGKRLLRAEVKAYLRRLHNDPLIRRKNQKNRSKLKNKVVPTGDLAVDYNIKMLGELKYDPAKVEAIIDTLAKNKKKKLNPRALDNINYSLLSFQRGDFSDVKRNETDGRIHHDWVRMKSDIRAAFRLKEHNNLTHTVDIRACHPTFWATYVYDIWKSLSVTHQSNGYVYSDSVLVSYYGNSAGSSNNTIINQYVGEDGDIIKKEIDKWIALWTDKDNDPRDKLGKELGLKRSTVKKLINSAINGSENRIFKWIGLTYPSLFKVWISTNIKETGNHIAKQFESDIMLSSRFYTFVETLGVKIISEHDGISVFANPLDDELEDKVEKIVGFLKEYSARKHGVPIVLKAKKVCALN